MSDELKQQLIRLETRIGELERDLGDLSKKNIREYWELTKSTMNNDAKFERESARLDRELAAKSAPLNEELSILKAEHSALNKSMFGDLDAGGF